MITTIEEALDLLRSEAVQGEVISRFDIHKENGRYILSSGPGNPKRTMSADEIIEDANKYSLAFQRRALLGGKINTVRAERLSNGTYFIVWTYEHEGKRKSFPFEPTDARGALRTLSILCGQGFSIEPPDMISQLKQAIDVLDEVIKDEDRIEHPYRHSLFFSTEEEAERVKQIVVEYMEGIFDPFISLDDDERITYELRFYTAIQMPEEDTWDIINMTDPDVYSFNVEDY